jgi:hypothetical protein
VLAGLASARLVIYLTGFPQTVRQYEAGNRLARVEYEGLQKAIATSSAPTLLLVNDRVGLAASQAMLRMAAWPNNGHVRRLIIVDSLGGQSGPQSSLRVSRGDREVRIEIVAGQDQRFVFAQVDASRLRGELVNQGLHYQIETVPEYSLAARVLRRLSKKVQPDQIAIVGRLVVTVPPEIGRSGLQIVGFDPRDMSSFSNDLTRSAHPRLCGPTRPVDGVPSPKEDVLLLSSDSAVTRSP